MYYLSGPGVDEDPVGVFGVDRNTGIVNVYSLLDREKVAFYRVRVFVLSVCKATALLFPGF